MLWPLAVGEQNEERGPGLIPQERAGEPSRSPSNKAFPFLANDPPARAEDGCVSRAKRLETTLDVFGERVAGGVAGGVAGDWILSISLDYCFASAVGCFSATRMLIRRAVWSKSSLDRAISYKLPRTRLLNQSAFTIRCDTAHTSAHARRSTTHGFPHACNARFLFGN